MSSSTSAAAAAAAPSVLAELSEYLTFALALAQSAGLLIQRAFHEPKSIDTKSNEIDIVTETDRACETLIKQRITAQYPSHTIIGEESHATPGLYDLHQSRVIWAVDPIDGTNNFVHSLPHTCVSIGVLVDGVCQVAVIHNPILLETFRAIRGQGAYLVHHTPLTAAVPDAADDFHRTHSSSPPVRLSVSTLTELSQCCVLTELGYDRSAAGIQQQLRRLLVLTTEHRLQSLRSFGSCALNICYVASGRCDAYYEGRDTQYGPKLWDSVAAEVVLTEAGGVLYDHDGGAFSSTSGRVLVANSKAVAHKLIEAFRQADALQ